MSKAFWLDADEYLYDDWEFEVGYAQELGSDRRIFKRAGLWLFGEEPQEQAPATFGFARVLDDD